MPDFFQIGLELTEVAKTVASAEDKILLAEASMALNQLAIENKRLMEENEELRRELALRKKLEYRDGSYYVVEDDGDMVGPICPECYMKKGLVYLTVGRSDGSRCTTCGAVFGGSSPAKEDHSGRALC